MPNPTEISLLNYHFEAAASDAVLTVMLNKSDKDYSTAEELNNVTELARFSYAEIREAVNELHRRGFLLEVKKPYGFVYAVNKLRISNMEFVYGISLDCTQSAVINLINHRSTSFRFALSLLFYSIIGIGHFERVHK